MPKKYILNILDNEDDYIYYTLLFDDKEECYKAKKLIETFDKKWCENYEEFEDMNYSEELLKMLFDNDIKCELPHIEKIYVR